MFLGIIVLFVVGSITFSYIKNKSQGSVPNSLIQGTESNSVEMVTKTHKVSKGENLWILAEKYYGDGFKWVEIATENKLSNASIIEEGQELTIPSLEAISINPVSELTTEKINEATYAVKEGDCLWDIAVRSYGDGYKWVEIAKVNNLNHPNIIHAGNILILPR